MPYPVPVSIPRIDPATGKIHTDFIPAGASGASARVALTIATGFVVPTWGSNPTTSTIGTDQHLAGHISRGAADIIANAILISGGTFTAGKKVVVDSETGSVLLRTTATAIEVAQLLVGAAPQWISLDGVIV